MQRACSGINVHSTGMENSKLADLEMRRLPGFYRLTVQLSTLLDHEHPLGHDYRLVLEDLGFRQEEISFLTNKVTRPTVEALKCWRGTTAQLVQTLHQSERDDALNDVRRWLGDLTGFTGANLPSIETLLEEKFSQPETRLQIPELFIDRGEETSRDEHSDHCLFEKITECLKNSFSCECQASLWYCWVTGHCQSKNHKD